MKINDSRKCYFTSGLVIWPGTNTFFKMTLVNNQFYWRRNLSYVLVLLLIWFMVSLGAGILWADKLNQFSLGGFKLGFWFAQQGSIYFFILIILVYIYLMGRLDKQVESKKP